jgi:hypothetical protein
MQRPKTFMELTWDEVQAHLGPFAVAPLRRRIEECLTEMVRVRLSTSSQENVSDHRRMEDAGRINQLIIELCGVWASGWSFGRGEPSGGGVVGSWCCDRHSFFPHGYSPDAVAEQTNRIVAALEEWHGHLQRLASLFAEVAPRTREEDVSLVARRAAARLVTWVMEATDCEDAWYSYAARTLSWLLEHLGMDAKLAETIVHATLAGEFSSWTRPAEEDQNRVVNTLVQRAAPWLPTTGHRPT